MSMKRLVILGAGAIGLAVLAFRSPEATVRSAPKVRPVRASVAAERTEAEVSPAPGIASKPEVGPFGAPREEERTTVPSPLVQREAEEARALLEERMVILQAELALTREQRLQVEKVWRERDAQVAAFHAEIRASGVFWIAGHDRRAREIMATSQVRIAAGLSPDQSRRFFDLLESGRLPEGVSFEVTPEVTVVR